MLVQGVIDMSMSFDFGVQLWWDAVLQVCSCAVKQLCWRAVVWRAVVLACSVLQMFRYQLWGACFFLMA